MQATGNRKAPGNRGQRCIVAAVSNVVRIVFLVCIAALLVFTGVCYITEPDSCAAVTVWPPWVWAVLGLVLTCMVLRRSGRRALFAGVGLWLIYLALLCEEPRGLIGGLFIGPPSGGIRVVSLNCAGGSTEVANEVAAYNPDVVLLQESPPSRDVETLARKLFGRDAAIGCGTDGSVIAHGRMIGPHKEARHATVAKVRLQSGLVVNLVSLRLSPPIFRTDIWSPSNWREQARLRRVHRNELRSIAQMIEPLGEALIVGGDFNCAGWDGALRELPDRLQDAYLARGTGWGNTVLNEFPILRFDQIKVSSDLRVLNACACKTRKSDHRMVVCDIGVVK